MSTPLYAVLDAPGIAPDAAPFRLLLENPYWHPSMLARTEAMRSLGGYRDVAAEDFDLSVRAVDRDHRLTRDAVPSIVYMRHARQTTIDPAWIASKTRNLLAQEAFEALGLRVPGLRPTWFEWRRAGFPAGRRRRPCRTTSTFWNVPLRASPPQIGGV